MHINNLESKPLNIDQARIWWDAACERAKSLPQLVRDRDWVLREYDREKYAALADAADIEAARDKELGGADNQNHLSILGDTLCVASLGLADYLTGELLYGLLMRFLDDSGPHPLLCELGCGYGWNIHATNTTLPAYGGDLSPNAVALATRFGVDAAVFDIQNVAGYRDFIRPNSIIVTVHAVEQLTSAAAFLEGLRTVRDRIRLVVQLEPGRYTPRGGPQGWARNLYTLRNGYNLDLELLLAQAAAVGDIRVLELAHDVIGINPLNPTHIMAWQFAKASAPESATT